MRQGRQPRGVLPQSAAGKWYRTPMSNDTLEGEELGFFAPITVRV